MLYCSVLVGDRQELVVNDNTMKMRDTDYKDVQNRIRY